MSEKRPGWEEIERDRDEPVRLPLDPETALRGLLAVDPYPEPDEPSAPADSAKKR
jgi:hypothetical protein